MYFHWKFIVLFRIKINIRERVRWSACSKSKDHYSYFEISIISRTILSGQTYNTCNNARNPPIIHAPIIQLPLVFNKLIWSRGSVFLFFYIILMVFDAMFYFFLVFRSFCVCYSYVVPQSLYNIIVNSLSDGWL